MNNTIVRSLSGAIFLIVMTGSLLWNPVVFAAVMLLSVVVMMWEYLTISLGKNFKTGKILSIITGVTIFVLFFLANAYTIADRYLYLAALPAALLFCSFIFEKDSKGEVMGEGYERAFFTITAIVYIALPFALTNTILFNNNNIYSPNLLLFLFILLWSSDVGAYVFGMSFGQKNGHKLYPEISPKKSWEGFWGGLGVTLLSALIIELTGFISIGIIHTLAIAIIVSVFGVLGDLAESLFKRNFAVKDSGSILPGHGGLLDRFDGALIAFPIAIVYLKIFCLI
ncbi:MAG: hypothetical protein A2X19_06020 [Bacteroidetes bacterium GWE2_39_28]|nr:MAG: hypothetical protein A2X19_06020 [Bacteroidetes bacterium GWE2_39_28]OFY12799.1 MAG: hypothetical protein A2X16_00800 [Bacteroidetes bacterium GWF2_39_10]OFZ11022.1 MAG: hypothetical protein A2465_00835 [Bacteroidetes bacterium RIFOXYC2_FULL_39_11]HCT93722.1 hypothetical protein [Rikenellaceae bacterium]